MSRWLPCFSGQKLSFHLTQLSSFLDRQTDRQTHVEQSSDQGVFAYWLPDPSKLLSELWRLPKMSDWNMSHFIDTIEFRIKILPMEALMWMSMKVFWLCDTAKGPQSWDGDVEKWRWHLVVTAWITVWNLIIGLGWCIPHYFWAVDVPFPAQGREKRGTQRGPQVGAACHCHTLGTSPWGKKKGDTWGAICSDGSFV